MNTYKFSLLVLSTVDSWLGTKLAYEHTKYPDIAVKFPYLAVQMNDKYGMAITSTSIYILVFEPERKLWWRLGDKIQLAPELKGMATSYHTDLAVYTKEEIIETINKITS